jgi:protocatechuate 3,4-dioxygenase, alpha subunit
MADRGPTPSQTVGPFLHLALADPALRDGVGAGHPGAITIHGFVVDGAGDPVPDAVVETWQYGGPFTRCATDADGAWEVRTVGPPAVVTLDGTPQAPHLIVSVFARGLLDRVVTRVYFAGDPANATDPALAAAGQRAPRLLASPHGSGSWRFDVHLQGADESVFFEL